MDVVDEKPYLMVVRNTLTGSLTIRWFDSWDDMMDKVHEYERGKDASWRWSKDDNYSYRYTGVHMDQDVSPLTIDLFARREMRKAELQVFATAAASLNAPTAPPRHGRFGFKRIQS
jgi:hypothetical protein